MGWKTQDERDVRDFFIDGLAVSAKAVLEEFLAVVGGDRDERLVEEVGIAKKGDKCSEVMVGVGDFAAIEGAHALDGADAKLAVAIVLSDALDGFDAAVAGSAGAAVVHRFVGWRRRVGVVGVDAEDVEEPGLSAGDFGDDVACATDDAFGVGGHFLDAGAVVFRGLSEEFVVFVEADGEAEERGDVGVRDDGGGVVALFPEEFGEARQRVALRDAVVEVFSAVDGDGDAGHKGGDGGARCGCGGAGAFEEETLGGESVDLGGSGVLRAVTAEFVGAEGVDHEEEDVGCLVRR